jgi:hypothetical protein
MDSIERKHRWKTMSYQDRFDAVFGTRLAATAPFLATAPSVTAADKSEVAPSLASLVRAGPPLSPDEREEMDHVRRATRARFQIEAELDREQQEVQQTRQAEHAVFRTTALGQLMR